MAVILEYTITGYGYFIIASTFSLGIGICWLPISSTKEIQHILHLIKKKITRPNANQSNEMKILFAEFIDTHATMKQLSTLDIFNEKILTKSVFFFWLIVYDFVLSLEFRVVSDFSDIFQPIIMSLFTWSLLAISGVAFIFQEQIVK